MGNFLKVVGRELLRSAPVLRESYFDYEFAHRSQSFRGVYGSFFDALEDAPAGKPLGYEHEDDTVDGEAIADELNQADYPVLYWLLRILPEARNVFDLGGNMGVAFYAYRRFLEYAPELRWTVCEIPSTAEAGRALAAKRGETQLFFTANRADLAGSDLLFTAGALQYIEEPFAEILAGLGYRPRHLLIHRVPLQDGPGFVTLQNNGNWLAPYKVANEGEFVAAMIELGYELVNQWPTFRTLEVLTHPFDRRAAYKGMYFRRRG